MLQLIVVILFLSFVGYFRDVLSVPSEVSFSKNFRNNKRRLSEGEILGQHNHNHNHNHQQATPVCSLYDISFKGIWKQSNPFFQKELIETSTITGNARYRPGGKDFICCGLDTQDYLDTDIVNECGKDAVDQQHYVGDLAHLGKL